MTTVAEMIRRLSNVDVLQASQESIEQTEKQFIQLQVEQMYAGERADNTAIEPPYAPSTVRRKKKKNQPTDRVTLRDKNEFQPSITAKVKGNEIEIKSDVDYEKYLEKRYTKKIFGLNDPNKATYTKEDFFPVFKEKIEQQTGLYFGK